jgi:predicted permease
VDNFLQDIQFGLRLLRKSPGFTLVTILTLALGIGANTVIFSAVNSVLLQSLPFRDPARLVKITFDDPGVGLRDQRFSVPEFQDLQSRSGVFEEVSLAMTGGANLTGVEHPVRLELLGVSPNYFSMLGVVPAKGRLFGPQDSAPGMTDGIVISDGLWRRAFGADPNIIGRVVLLDDDPSPIVGVLPPGFRHPGRTVVNDVDVWVAGQYNADPFPRQVRGARIFEGAIGRLKPGITLQEAQSRLSVMAVQVRSDFATDYPSNSTWTVRLLPLQESLVGNVRPTLVVLMGAVILVVLIASVNIANLLLARASARRREISMRLALGAGRRRIVVQVLTESLLLSVIAGAVGVLTAQIALRGVIQFVPFRIPRQTEIGIDWVVLGFATLLSILTGLLFGLAPAIQSTRTPPLLALREGARGSGYSRKTHRFRRLLINAQLAIAVVLMIGAGLLLRTFWRLLDEDPGFNSNHVVVSSIRLPVRDDPKLSSYLSIDQQARFARESLRQLRAIPGVEVAALVSDLPGAPAANNTDLIIEDIPSDSSQKLAAEVIRVSPDFFRTLQTPIARGRFFEESDEADRLPVAIVDEATAAHYWPNRDAIGRRLRLSQPCTFSSGCQDASQQWLTVVGIVRNIKYDGLDVNGVPHIYTPVYQQGGRLVSLVLRTPLAPALLESQIRGAMHTVDPSLPVFNIRSLDDVMDASLAQRRFSAELVGVFAAIALLLASLGIYGLLAYLVGQRSQEIGVRIALGAQRGHILRQVVGQGAFLAAVGVGTGLVLAAITAPAISVLLYGIRAFDPFVFLAVPSILLCVSLAASYFPARRAAKISPITALREG